jgi:hypothetical protein
MNVACLGSNGESIDAIPAATSASLPAKSGGASGRPGTSPAKNAALRAITVSSADGKKTSLRLTTPSLADGTEASTFHDVRAVRRRPPR